MVKKTKKQAFTIVELVIVIAVIAILAAIIIPTYSNLVKKANEATALVDAKNMITEMLADILSGDKDAADILVFSKKGNDVFLYGYDASRGVVLPYKVSPLKDFGKNLTVTDGHEFYNQAASFCETIKGTDINKVTVNIDDWRKPEVLNLGVNREKSTVEELGFDKNTMAVFANYDIVPESFAKKNSGGEEVHVHEWGTPEYTWEKGEIYKCTATRKCSAAGCNFENGTETETVTATYDVIKEATCTEAGKGKYTATFTESAFATQTQEITVDMLGHNYSEYKKLNDTNHKVKCSRCGDEKTEPHDGATSCSKCLWEKATVDITLSLDKSALTLECGDSATITATVTPEGTTVTWSGNNDAVATVDGGLVKAVGTGTAVITATAGDKTATCTVTVTDKWKLKDGLLYRNGEKFTGKNPSNAGENGLYYVDGALANGTVDGHEFRKGMLVVSSSDTVTNMSSYYKVTHAFDKSSIAEEYLTSKTLLLTNSTVFNSPGSQSYVRNYFSINFADYSVSSAKAYIPSLKNGLEGTPWTAETVSKYIEEVNKTAGNNCYESISAFPFYVQGKDYDNFKALTISDLKYSEYLKLKYRNNVIVTGADTAKLAYFVKSGSTEKISAYAYRNDSCGMGLVIGSDGKVYGYDWSETSGSYSCWTSIKANATTTDLGNSTGYSVVNSGNTYTIKYNGAVVETLTCTISDISDYNLEVEKNNLNGVSISDECSDEELLAIATMYGYKTEVRITDDPEIAELYLKAFWKQYTIKLVDSAARQTFYYSLEEINKSTLSSSNFYYAVMFTNGLGNAYQDMEHVGPIVEIEMSKNS